VTQPKIRRMTSEHFRECDSILTGSLFARAQSRDGHLIEDEWRAMNAMTRKASGTCWPFSLLVSNNRITGTGKG
jgi:hypothetical protein